MPMISPFTPDTILLGIWHEGNRCAITGSAQDAHGTPVPDVLAVTGEGWTAVVQALEAAALIGARHVVILSNDTALVRALSPPFPPPAPTQKRRIFFSRTEWVDVGEGGDADHWRTLQLLGGQWGGRFRAMQVQDLPKARALWQQC
jgi:hypothetical protein